MTRRLLSLLVIGLLATPISVVAQPTDDGHPCDPCFDEGAVPTDGVDVPDDGAAFDGDDDRDDDTDELPDELTPWDVEPEP